jgi:hypothetical protein
MSRLQLQENTSRAAGWVFTDKDPSLLWFLSMEMSGVQDQIPVARARRETHKGNFGDNPARP